MRHRKAGRKLKRTASHRKATLSALCTALFRHKRITTTVAKAKETRMVAEKILTRAKNAASGNAAQSVHARRIIARYIQDRTVVKELFGEIASKISGRAGGYTRVVKLGRRFGDSAEVAVLEMVDFPVSDTTPKPKKAPKKKEEKEFARGTVADTP
ncbi:MAG TPA: 50S ribosomal protein L17 [Bacteroidota bacterium]|nr:50S ribosomal protein L17 [Bacteroidota bacterium]